MAIIDYIPIIGKVKKEYDAKIQELNVLEKSMINTVEAVKRSNFTGFLNENLQKSSINNKKEVKHSYYAGIYEFFRYIPAAHDILKNVVDAVLHKDINIRRVDGVASPANEQRDFLKIFLERQENAKIHEFMITNHLLFNSSYAELVDTKGLRAPSGKKFGYMYPISSMQSQILVNEKEWNAGRVIPVSLQVKAGDGGGAREIDWNNVFHFSTYGISNITYGESKFMYNDVFFQLISKAIQKNLSKLENKVDTNIAFLYDKEVSVDEIISNSQLISALYAGHLKAGTPLHVPGGVALHEMKDKLQDLDYMSLIRLGIEIVRGMFNYPFGSVGTQNSGTGVDTTNFVNITVNPLKKKYEKAFNAKIVREMLGITDWEIELPEMKSGSSLDIAREGEISVRNGAMTINEWRKENYFPKLEEPWADKYTIRTDRYVYDLTNDSFNALDPSTPNLENNPDPNTNQ